MFSSRDGYIKMPQTVTTRIICLRKWLTMKGGVLIAGGFNTNTESTNTYLNPVGLSVRDNEHSDGYKIGRCKYSSFDLLETPNRVQTLSQRRIQYIVPVGTTDDTRQFGFYERLCNLDLPPYETSVSRHYVGAGVVLFSDFHLYRDLEVTKVRQRKFPRKMLQHGWV
eukprot:TRINITY_DN1544_c1_g1_i2.p1 TRINITY_DN1544_c1_g1~~TRINITY_DN1544_c1_g1_i2.p1  ORF type:complete len:167 (-),score=3.60 TRINITY_DN1544_c1_g1_i2:21-521(-)